MEQIGIHIDAIKNIEPFGLIGDLDGKYKNFATWMADIGAISQDDIGKDINQLTWTGGNMKIVFSGDILADRNCDGFQILLAISSLREQAQAAGGDITVLAGNHEERMIGYLIGVRDNKDWDELLGVSPDTNSPRDHIGMTELDQFLSEKEQKLNRKERRLKVLSNMQGSPIGKKLLKEICKMKLVHIGGGGIHFHTQPSLGMLNNIDRIYTANNSDLQQTVNIINSVWCRILTELLLKQTPNNRVNELYRDITMTYLYGANGTWEHIVN